MLRGHRDAVGDSRRKLAASLKLLEHGRVVGDHAKLEVRCPTNDVLNLVEVCAVRTGHFDHDGLAACRDARFFDAQLVDATLDAPHGFLHRGLLE